MKALLFLLGIVSVTTFLLMRRHAMDFYSNGQCFTIIDLEFPDSKAGMESVIAGMDEKAKTAVLSTLDTDYLFMVGIFPLIMLLNLIALRNLGHINSIRTEINDNAAYRWWKVLLIIFIGGQVLGWGLDLMENVEIEKWINTGTVTEATEMFSLRTLIKFILAFGGAGVGLISWLVTNIIIKKLIKKKDEFIGLSPL